MIVEEGEGAGIENKTNIEGGIGEVSEKKDQSALTIEKQVTPKGRSETKDLCDATVDAVNRVSHRYDLKLVRDGKFYSTPSFSGADTDLMNFERNGQDEPGEEIVDCTPLRMV